jgi:hypothetical protein
MLLRLAPLRVAIPELPVEAVPEGVPFSVKLTVLPLNGRPPEVNVAMSVAVPPAVPEPLTALIVVEAWIGVVVIGATVAAAAALNVARTMIQSAAELNVEVAVTACVELRVAISLAAGEVAVSCCPEVYPVPGVTVPVYAVGNPVPANTNSLAIDVVAAVGPTPATDPVFCACAVRSRGLVVSSPLYS